MLAAQGGSVVGGHRTYSALVQGDADLVGLVAYALYKRDKLKFCEQFRGRNSREPTQNEIEAFIATSNLDTRVQGYRAEAELLLEAMTEYQLDDAIEEVRRQADKELVRKLSESKSWSRSIAEALVGSIFVAVLWGTLVLVLYTNKVGFSQVAREALSLDIAPAPPASSAPR